VVVVVLPSRPCSVAFEVGCARREGYCLDRVMRDEVCFGVSEPEVTTGYYVCHYGDKPVIAVYQDEGVYSIQFYDPCYDENVVLFFVGGVK